MRKRPGLWVVGVWVVAMLLAVLAAPAARAQGEDAGPKGLLLLYRTAPADRMKLRSYMESTGVPRLQKWRQDAVLENYRVLFSRYTDSDSWDMLVFLSFRQSSDMRQWNAIERHAPAGLLPEGAALTTAISTYVVDTLQARSSDHRTDSREHVYLAIPYEYVVSAGEYAKYVEGYVKPQLDGWMDEGVVTQYELYVARNAAGRPWNAVLLLEYKDDEALGKREKTVALVRDRLKSNAAWKALSESKQTIRMEKQPIVAEEMR